MATVYFVREGRGNNRTKEANELPLVDILKAFPNIKLIWSFGAPTFNPELAANAVSSYRFVVIHVVGERAGEINKDGFWTLVDVLPKQFETKLSNLGKP